MGGIRKGRPTCAPGMGAAPPAPDAGAVVDSSCFGLHRTAPCDGACGAIPHSLGDTSGWPFHDLVPHYLQRPGAQEARWQAS